MVTDTEGNVIWEAKTHGYEIKDVILYENYEFTDIRAQSMEPPSISLEVGQHFKMTVNGVDYEGTIELDSGSKLLKINAGYIVIVGLTPGVTQQLRNFTNAAGTLTLTVTTKVYQTIDKNYMPISCSNGTGPASVILNNSYQSIATGALSVACNMGQTEGNYATSLNYGIANGFSSFAHGFKASTNGSYSHAEGLYTIASGKQQHVEGAYNIEDTENKYAHIVGNGYLDTETNTGVRSNAYTLDWQGNAWFAGSIESTSIILSSPDGSRFNITVNNDGQL